MKQLILLVGTFVAISSGYANTTSLPLNKNSVQLNALGSAWKMARQITQPVSNQNDIAMVYGGADISRRPTLILHTAST